jgi:hypothetical protein
MELYSRQWSSLVDEGTLYPTLELFSSLVDHEVLKKMMELFSRPGCSLVDQGAI